MQYALPSQFGLEFRNCWQHANPIAEAALRQVELRKRWFFPLEWVEWVDETVSSYPRRPVPRDEAAAKELKK